MQTAEWRLQNPEGAPFLQCRGWQGSSALCILHSALCLLFLGCNLSPLTNKIELGKEPFVILVGEHSGQTDLFVSPARGGETVRITFNRLKEAAPGLHPTGGSVAFLRRSPTAIDSSPARLVVLNLVNQAERETSLPEQIGVPRRVGWSSDGMTLYVLGDVGIARSPAPPAPLAFVPVGPDDAGWATADTATSIELGTPAIGRIVTCARDCISSAAKPWCVMMPDGKRQELGRVVTPFRWGSDSLAFFESGGLRVYSLGGGQPRRMELNRLVNRPRDGTYWSPRGGR